MRKPYPLKFLLMSANVIMSILPLILFASATIDGWFVPPISEVNVILRPTKHTFSHFDSVAFDVIVVNRGRQQQEVIDQSKILDGDSFYAISASIKKANGDTLKLAEPNKLRMWSRYYFYDDIKKRGAIKQLQPGGRLSMHFYLSWLTIISFSENGDLKPGDYLLNVNSNGHKSNTVKFTIRK